MFHLSQRADYGLILLSTLVDRGGNHFRGENSSHLGGEEKRDKFVSISSIARKHQISPKFLSQIAADLKKAGILESKEGVSGGYTLAKDPSGIKLLDVLKILDGELVEGKCFEDDHECVCGAGEMWAEMREQLEQTIGSKTVADLVIHK